MRYHADKKYICVYDFFSRRDSLRDGVSVWEIERKMKIRLNEDKKIVETVVEGLKAKGGYCPCWVGKKPEYKCMCEEFRSQIQDPDFEGYCHCGLFYKSK